MLVFIYFGCKVKLWRTIFVSLCYDNLINFLSFCIKQNLKYTFLNHRSLVTRSIQTCLEHLNILDIGRCFFSICHASVLPCFHCCKDSVDKKKKFIIIFNSFSSDLPHLYSWETSHAHVLSVSDKPKSKEILSKEGYRFSASRNKLFSLVFL